MKQPGELTVAQQLFQTPWMCKIQEIHRHTDAHLKEVGYHTTGDKQWDKELMHQWLTCYLTIVQMVTLHSNGAPVIINDPTQAANIYKLIYKHLDNWKHLVETSLNDIVPPLDDLRKMDDFAAALYPIAQQYIDMESPITGVMAKLRGMGHRTKFGSVKPTSPNDIKPRLPTIGRRSVGQQLEQTGFDSQLGFGFDNPPAAAEPKPTGHSPVSDAIARTRFRKTGQWE